VLISVEFTQTGTEQPPPAPPAPEASRLVVVAALAGLAVLVVVCFLPLTGYFFSQDDYILMYKSTHETGDQLALTFGSKPHHFRPLTKIFYFLTMYRVFGLNPLPYHVVSLIVHLANSLLVFVLLRRFRLSVPAAYIAAGLFALNVAWFHAIGWISCIQQLAAVFFMLLSMWFAIVALEIGRRKHQWMSLIAYLLALMSLEQAFLLAIIILLIPILRLIGRYKTRRVFLTLLPHLLLMLFYAEIRLWWKGVPESGTSEFLYGENILINLITYTGALYEFWPKVGDLIPRVKYTFNEAFYFFGIVILFNIARWRLAHVLFCVVFVLATLMPALPLKAHSFYYHTYAASFGAIFLLGLIIDDLFRVLGAARLRKPAYNLIIAGLAVIVVFAMSYYKTRWNEQRALDPKRSRHGSFVLRRAIIAERAYDDIVTKAGDLTGVRKIHIGRGSPDKGLRVDEPRDLFWAFGNGVTWKVLFDGYETTLHRKKEPEYFAALRAPDARIFFYDKQGQAYTYDEVLGGEEPSP
jgi:hypothetical protein